MTFKNIYMFVQLIYVYTLDQWIVLGINKQYNKDFYRSNNCPDQSDACMQNSTKLLSVGIMQAWAVQKSCPGGQVIILFSGRSEESEAFFLLIYNEIKKFEFQGWTPILFDPCMVHVK